MFAGIGIPRLGFGELAQEPLVPRVTGWKYLKSVTDETRTGL